MEQVTARSILDLPNDVLWTKEGPVTVLFEDGKTLETTWRHNILTAYYWKAVRVYPNVTLISSMHAGSVSFNGSSMLRVLEKVIFGIFVAYQQRQEPIDRVYLARLTFETINDIYNDFSINLGAWVTTFSAFDMIEIMTDPVVKAANDAISADSPMSIDLAYKAISDRLLDGEGLRHNNIVRAVRVGTAPLGQVLQCITAVGFRTDMNADIFPRPVTRSFFEGLTDLYSSMIESRSGAKAAAYNKDLISKTETFNRELQIVAQSMQRLHHVDCGTKLTMKWYIQEEHVKILDGVHYYLEDPMLGGNPELHTFAGNEKDMIGQTVFLRTVFGCVHPDPEGMCEVCYGTLANSIMPHTNIGHLSATIFCAKCTQMTLGTKHHDASAKVDPMVLGELERKFFVRKEMDTIFFRKEMANRPMEITFALREVPGITDTEAVDDVEVLIPERVSSISDLVLAVKSDKDDADECYTLTVSMYNRSAFLTMDALKFIRHQLKQRKCEFVHSGTTPRITIEMTGFDVRRPFLRLPYTHVNMVEYMQDTQSFLYSSSSSRPTIPMSRTARRFVHKAKVLNQYQHVTDGLVAFVNRTNHHLRANFTHMAMIAYAFTARDPIAKDYRLGKPGLTAEYAKHSEIMMYRSLAPMMAHKNQAGGLTSIESFLVPYRNESPFDAALESGAVPV